MRGMRYQAKADLKEWRKISGLSKEEVAREIGYTERYLEKFEKENAVSNEETARKRSIEEYGKLM